MTKVFVIFSLPLLKQEFTNFTFDVLPKWSSCNPTFWILPVHLIKDYLDKETDGRLYKRCWYFARSENLSQVFCSWKI